MVLQQIQVLAAVESRGFRQTLLHESVAAASLYRLRCAAYRSYHPVCLRNESCNAAARPTLTFCPELNRDTSAEYRYLVPNTHRQQTNLCRHIAPIHPTIAEKTKDDMGWIASKRKPSAPVGRGR